MMTFDELMSKVLAMFPDALVDEDKTGELVISTGLKMGPDETVISFEDK